jgi:hypothetical protein
MNTESTEPQELGSDQVAPGTPTYLYMLHSKGRAVLVNVPGHFTTEQWEDLQVRFCISAGLRWSQEHVDCYQLDETQRHGDVYWTSGLAGMQGAWFTLLPLPSATNRDLMQLKSNLRRDRDVVGLTVVRPKRWIQLRPAPVDTTVQTP